MTKLWEQEKKLEALLVEAGVDSPGLCARMLVEHVLGLDPVHHILSSSRTLSADEENRLEDLVQRRAAGEPMAYILGRKAFYEHEFMVSPATLVPRPETEMLVDLALGLLPESRIRFADIGAGSGCIGLSLMAKRPCWHGVLLDISGEALHVASRNASRIAANPCLIQGDMFNLPFRDNSLDLLISNPPYIAFDEFPEMDRTLAYEPPSALFSGNEGLGHIQGLALEAKRVLRAGGLAIIEHGYLQSRKVCEILTDAGFMDVNDHNDLAGLPRCATGQKIGN